MVPKIAEKTTGTDPYVIHEEHRIVTVWMTNTVVSDYADADGFEDVFYAGRYREFMKNKRTHLPKCVQVINAPDKSIAFKRNSDIEGDSSRITVFQSLSGRLAISLELFVGCDLFNLTEILNDLYYRTFTISNINFDDFIRLNIAEIDDSTPIFHETYHQFVSLAENLASEDIDARNVRSIIHRYVDKDVEIRSNFLDSEAAYPKNLNSRKRSLCATSHFVTVVYNQQEYIENTMILSILQLLFAKQALSLLRTSAVEIVKEIESRSRSVSASSKDIETILKIEKSMEILYSSLILNVEEPMDIGLIIPSLRSQEFHNAVFEASSIKQKKENLSVLYSRLESVLSSLKGAAQAHEQERAAIRRGVFAAVFSGISLIAIPISLILAFFSSPVLEAPKNVSIFDMSANSFVYISIFGSFAFAFFVAFLIWTILSINSHRKRINIFDEVKRNHGGRV
ncbi:MAG: hypothetical protein ABJE63_11895 [Lentilitoribacter sp.]